MKRYEWVIETIEDDEITDVDHADKYPGPQPGCDVGLVLDTLDKHGDIKDRYWAYVKDGVLPAEMHDAMDRAVKTPARFIKEVEAYHAAQSR